MKSTLTLYTFLCLSISCFAQNVNLLSQADVDGFDSNTTTINGNLNIVGNTNSSIAITDLSNLSNLTTIIGDLIIQEHDNISQIDDLSNITSIGGSLDIKNNTSINSINGLSNITTLGNSLYIEYNDVLVNIDAFSGLNSINGDAEITYNPLLTNINGLANISSYAGDLLFFQNITLQNLDALSNLTSIGENLHISYCNTLVNLNGLSNLISIGNNLRIDRNDALIDINGLLGITNIHDLSITYNQILPNIDGLANLTNIDNYIIISNNPLLSNINGLSNITTINTEIEISSNDILSNIDPLLGLTTTTQDIIISNNPSLTNINGLANVTTIGGDLWLSNNSLVTNVNSLSNLTTINHDLVILQHENLVDLTGLSNLTHVEEDIYIRDNVTLPNLDGLSNIISPIGRLFITTNNSLSNINGLSGITEIFDDIWIQDNPVLENINGFSNITSVMDDIRIDNNDILTNINGFCGLITMGNMSILDNDALLNMDGLANFSSTITYLDIDGNSSITNLDGLSQVNNIANWLRVRDNPNLSNCCGIQYLVSTPGAVGLNIITISGNPSECSNENDIINAVCANTCTINITETSIDECDGNTYDVQIKAIANYPGTNNTYQVSDGTNTYGPFSYGSDELITLPADGLTYTLVFSDSDDANCNNQIQVSQDPCFNECLLTIDNYSIGDCDDNGTNTDSSDDTYEVTFNASALNSGISNSYAVTDDNNYYGTFSYGNNETITLPADGNIYNLTFSDNDHAVCLAFIDVSQESCSDFCLLTIDNYSVGDCDDNGTNTDSSDDTYEVTFNASALNSGISNSYAVTDGNNYYGTFTYGNNGTITLPADGNIYTLSFSDNDHAVCLSFIDVSQESCSSTSINELAQSGISISPNPFHNAFEISSINNINIESLIIHDATGKLIRKIQNPSYGFIDFSNIPTGIYFIKLQTEKGIFSSKLLKL